MRWYFLFLFVAIFLYGCHDSPSTQQSFKTTSPNDSVQFWTNTAKDNSNLEPKNRLVLIDKAYQQNSSLQDGLTKVKNLSSISLAYMKLKDSLNFRKTNRELIFLSNKIDNKIAHGEAHWDLGAYLATTKPDSSFYHYNEAYNLFINEELGDKKDYPGLMKLAIANLLDSHRDYIGAEKEVVNAIESFKKVDAKKRLYSAYNALGAIQNGLNKFDLALKYYSTAKDYIQFIDEDKQIYLILSNKNNIAFNYLRKVDYKKAFDLYDELEKQSLAENNHSLLIRKVYASKAISGFKSNMLSAEQAITLIEKSNHGLDSMNNSYDKARNNQFLAEILFDKDEIDKAISYALEAKKIAESTTNNDRLLNVLELLSQIDAQNSNVYAQQYFELNDRLMAEERSIQEKFARIQYETDEIEQNNIVLTRQRKIWTGIAIALLLLGAGAVVIIAQRKANQSLKFEKAQQKSNQEIYNLMLTQQGKLEEGKKSEQKRISEELHDSVLGQMLGIRLILSGLNERDDEQAVEQRAELIEKLQGVEEEIRTMSHELSDAAYNQVDNFLLAIQELLHTFKTASDIDFKLDYDKSISWDRLDGDIKINIYRIVQESIKNSIKHAQCNTITVTLGLEDEKLILTVSDDGKGFNTKKFKKGIGLKNILSRTKKINGIFSLESKEGEGTKTIVSFPTETFENTPIERTKAQSMQAEKSEI